jgi:hypothetical protein
VTVAGDPNRVRSVDLRGDQGLADADFEATIAVDLSAVISNLAASNSVGLNRRDDRCVVVGVDLTTSAAGGR